MATLSDPPYYEVQVTIIPHDGTKAFERTFPKVKNLQGMMDNSETKVDVSVSFVAIKGDDLPYIYLEKDLKGAGRCHCYEDLMKED